jgi:hypothetical protein
MADVGWYSVIIMAFLSLCNEAIAFRNFRRFVLPRAMNPVTSIAEAEFQIYKPCIVFNEHTHFASNVSESHIND